MVVAGLKGPENWGMIEELAHLLGSGSFPLPAALSQIHIGDPIMNTLDKQVWL